MMMMMTAVLSGNALRFVRKLSKSVTNRAFHTVCLLGSAALLASGCGGGGDSVANSGVSGGSGETDTATLRSGTPETGPTSRVVHVGTDGTAEVALFPDGTAYYSPDGFNLGGGGSTVLAYVGSLQVADIVPLNNGVEALFSDGSVNFSPDGHSLGGGGQTVAVYHGTVGIKALVAVGPGVDAVFDGSVALASGGKVFYSPDGLNLDGGGQSISIYSGTRTVSQVVPVGTGEAVLALFSDGAAYYSPDNRNLSGGGNTISAAPGAGSPVSLLVKVEGGVLAQLANGAVYRSPDGLNLGGGGNTIHVGAWNNTIPNGPFPPRDSAPGAKFLGRLWLSGGFALATNSDSCYDTCSLFDLWSSTDLTGVTWNPTASFATATAPDPRDVTPIVHNGVADVPSPTDFYDAYSPIIVWNGKLTAIGATVWSSADGSKWARQNLADGVTAAPGPVPVRPTENSRALVLGNTLFFLQTDTGEVYSTTDPNAAVWTDLGAMPGYVPRCGPVVFVLQGKMWVEGGGACDYSAVYNDVWSSTNGIDWTSSTTTVQWSARMWACVAVSDSGTVWIAGGFAPTDWNNVSGVTVRYDANHSDVWYTKDGLNWGQLKADYGSGLPDDGKLEPRHAPNCSVVGDSDASSSLLVIGGSGYTTPDGRNERVSNSIRELPLPAGASLP